MMPDLLLLAQINLRWRPDWLSLFLGFILGALLFFGWQKVRPYAQRWQKQIRGRVQETRQWVRSGIDSRYRADLALYLERYHLFGQQVSLPQIFVTPRLLAPPQLTDLSQLRTNGPEQLFYLWPALASRIAHPSLPTVSLSQTLLNGQRVALTGEAGSGKTTLLAYGAYLAATATEDQPHAFLLQRVPLFAHLTAIDLSAAAADPALPLLQISQSYTGVMTKAGLEKYLRDALESGHLLLFLDGWDNLLGAEQAAATQWLSQLLNRYPEIQIIAAAPLRHFGPLTELNFTPTMLLPWRVGQARAYYRQWSADAPPNRSIPVTTFWQNGQNALETSLRHHLIRLKKEAPARHSDLFSYYFNHCLEPENKTLAWLPPFAAKIWQTMAFRLVEQEQFALSVADIASLVTEVAITDGIKERDLLGQWQTFSIRTGLIQAWPDNRLSFRNSLWRDFCAAAYLSQADNTILLQEKLTQPGWRELIRFYVGHNGGQSLAPTLLEQKEKAPWYDSLFQLAAWLPENDTPEEWKRPLLVQLGKMVLQHELPLLLRLRAMATMALTRDPGTRVFWQQLLQRPDPILREMAVLCLPLLGSEKVLELWLRMLKDQQIEVRRAVIWAMAWAGETVTENPLLTALVGEDEHINQTVAEALAGNGLEGWEILKEALQDSDLGVRRAAIWGLTQLEEPWVVELLTKVERDDKEWIVRSAAKEARQEILARREPFPWRPLEAADLPWVAEWSRQPAGEGVALTGLLIETMRRANKPSVRAAAALTLGHLAAKEGVGPLQQALQEPHTELVEAAFAALGQIRRAYGGSEW